MSAGNADDSSQSAASRSMWDNDEAPVHSIASDIFSADYDMIAEPCSDHVVSFVQSVVPYHTIGHVYSITSSRIADSRLEPIGGVVDYVVLGKLYVRS